MSDPLLDWDKTARDYAETTKNDKPLTDEEAKDACEQHEADLKRDKEKETDSRIWQR